MKAGPVIFVSPFCVLLCAIAFGLMSPVHARSKAEKMGVFQNNKDIGDAKKGRAFYDAVDGTYHVTGGGANIWGQADAFQYVYRQTNGDVMLAADIDFAGKGTEAHRKAALMIRQDLKPDSAYVDIAVHGDGLAALQYRPTAGAMTQEIRSDMKAPVRVRIYRRGDEFVVATGNPGEQMRSAGVVTVTMHDPVYVGLAVCSHNSNVLETAVFSNLVLQEQQQPPSK